MKTAALIFLFALACSASTVDPNQIYTSNGVTFHWIFEPDYGYLALDWKGEQISGLNYGFTPWLVDDGEPASIEPPVCCQPNPPSPPAGPPATVTPEPGTYGMGFLILLIISKLRGKAA